MLLNYVNFDIAVPGEYWQEGRTKVPQAVRPRVDRMELYFRLFNGEFAPLRLKEKEMQVRINYFERVATFIPDLLMAFPPTINGLPDGFDVNVLQDAIYDVIVNMVRFGTGVFYANDENLQSIDPRLWFPWEDGDTIITSTHLVNDEGMFGKTRNTVMRFGEGFDDMLTFEANDNVNLGELTDEEEIATTVQRPIVPCPLRPATGEWGKSMYNVMVPMVIELTKRYSSSSNILDEHSDPTLVAIHGEEKIPRVRGRDTLEAGVNRQDIERYNILSELKSKFFETSKSVKDVKYLTWDGKLESNFKQIAEVEDTLYASIHLPASFQGVLRGGGIPSGQTLKRMFVSTYTMIENLQHALGPNIQKALKVLGHEVTIEWLNPIDRVDVVNVQNATAEQSQAAQEETEVVA